MNHTGRSIVALIRLILVLFILTVSLTAVSQPLFAADCEPAETICRWYEDQSGEFCDYVWCMQDHIRMGLIDWSCLYGQAQLTFC
jgi:hypothetical protein